MQRAPKYSTFSSQRICTSRFSSFNISSLIFSFIIKNEKATNFLIFGTWNCPGLPQVVFDTAYENHFRIVEVELSIS